MMALGLRSQDVPVSVLARWKSAGNELHPGTGIDVKAFGCLDRGAARGPGRLAWLASLLGFAFLAAWRVGLRRCDGVIVYGLSPAFLPAALLARVRRIPYVFVQYDLYEPTAHDPVWKRLAARLYRFSEAFLARGASLLALSESDLLVRKFQAVAPGLPAFRNWPPTDTEYFFEGDAARGRELAGAAPGVPLIVYTGAISRLEGVDTLIEAMSKVVESHPSAVLAIAGSVGGDMFPGEAPDYHAMPSRLGIPANVRFLGMVNRSCVRDLLASADCLAMPKRDHVGNAAASPIKLGEYLASGRPVVASNLCGIDGWLETGRSVFLVVPGDSLDLGRAICTVLSSPEKAAAIGAAGREAGIRHCDFKHWGARFVVAYQAAIGAR